MLQNQGYGENPSCYKVQFKNKEVNLLKKPNKKLICSCCKQLMSVPLQSYQGNLACKKCYEKKKEELSDKSMCPLDGERNEREAFEDKMINREIINLQVKCLYVQCDWIGALNDIDVHERKNCKFAKTICEYCKMEVLNHNYQTHLQKECKTKEEECEVCGKLEVVAELEKHKLGCNGTMKCPYGCSENDFKKSDITDHLLHCERIKSGNVCPYSIFWCAGISEGEDSKEHMEKHAKNPLHLIKELFKIKNENDELREKLEHSQKKIHILENEQQSFKQKMDSEVNKLQTTMYQADKRRELLQEREKEFEENLSRFEHRLFIDYDKKISDLKQLVRQLSPVVSTSSPDVKSLKKLNDSSNRLNLIEKEVAMLNANLADAELSMQLLENTTTNGRQIWRIDNYQYRNRQAEQGNINALHSAPCFTAPNGYKFCIRVYPNGDGMGKNTHLSIYFVLMKNHYDSLLEWPFYRKVTFKVLNHKDISRSKKETFISDKTSSSFQKPKRDMNIAAGCPKFLSKEELFNGGYLIDDSIFIETIVEEVEVKKSIIPIIPPNG